MFNCISGTPLPYDTLDELRNRLEDIAPHLTRWGKLEPAETYNGVADQVAEVRIITKFASLHVPIQSFFEILCRPNPLITLRLILSLRNCVTIS